MEVRRPVYGKKRLILTASFSHLLTIKLTDDGPATACFCGQEPHEMPEMDFCQEQQKTSRGDGCVCSGKDHFG
jgi:hypothetical protein